VCRRSWRFPSRRRPPAPGPRASFSTLPCLPATLLTTTAAGAFQAGVNLFEYPWRIYEGWPFAVSILAILTAHEMGHYLVSRRHGLDVTLPFFLPGLPFPPPLPGTFGALIRIRSPILDKRALLDVGCSGPLIGLVVIVPVLVIGLLLSPVKELPLHAHGKASNWGSRSCSGW
jgi:Zn-dependent protease